MVFQIVLTTYYLAIIISCVHNSKGYGDIPLSGDEFKAFAIVFIVSLVFIIASAISISQEIFAMKVCTLFEIFIVPILIIRALTIHTISVQEEEAIKKKMMSQKLTPEMLQALDTDGNGVDKMEFLIAGRFHC